MTQLGAVIYQTILHHYGREDVLLRLSGFIFWISSFGALMGSGWQADLRGNTKQSA